MSSDYERYHDAHDGWHRTSACVGTLAMDGVPKQGRRCRRRGGRRRLQEEEAPAADVHL